MRCLGWVVGGAWGSSGRSSTADRGGRQCRSSMLVSDWMGGPVIREADVEFCRNLWNISEIAGKVSEVLSSKIATKETRDINWVGPITVSAKNGGSVRIAEPSAHTGVRPVRIRVISRQRRESVTEMSSYLVMHCHGGGYVATSSVSHQTYLLEWAKRLDCCIVSVDHSLSPENPFPRPTEEVLYAYAIANPSKLESVRSALLENCNERDAGHKLGRSHHGVGEKRRLVRVALPQVMSGDARLKATKAMLLA